MRYRLRTLLIALALVPPLIAWLSIPYLRGRYSKEMVSRTHLGLLEEAIQLYSLHTGELPSGLSDLVTLPAQLVNPAEWEGPYLDGQSLPVDPWCQPFGYKSINHATAKFEIWSNGPDQKSGTNDDIRMKVGP